MTDKTNRLLALPEVVARTSLSESTICRLVDRREFPKPARITRNRNAWPESEVDAWIADRLARRFPFVVEVV